MATHIDINITDLSGRTFTIKLNLGICLMKWQIAHHYEEKYKHEFCKENGVALHELGTNCTYKYDWYNILLIYKGEILEQSDIDADKYTEDDFKEDNNMNIIIINNGVYNYTDNFNDYHYYNDNDDNGDNDNDNNTSD